MSNQSASHFNIGTQSLTAPQLPAGLYLVSTPLGNLKDITLRGLETLAGCAVVACEDTRKSGILLKHFGINKPKVSYTEHNADTRGPDLIRQISEGAAIALISDAGTPLVSDPGYRLVCEAIHAGLQVIPVPGPSAPIAALSASGLGSEDFRFVGFLPHKKSQVKKFLSDLADESSTLIFFESPNRITESLSTMADAFGGTRNAVVARELTKMFETFHRGSLDELHSEFSDKNRVRGEIVVLVEGAVNTGHFEAAKIDELLREALTTMKPSQAAGEVARKTGLARPELYERVMELKEQS